MSMSTGANRKLAVDILNIMGIDSTQVSSLNLHLGSDGTATATVERWVTRDEVKGMDMLKETYDFTAVSHSSGGGA